MSIIPFIPLIISVPITIILLLIKKISIIEKIIIILLFIINLNPVIINNKESNQKILFILDTKPKMNIEKAKQDINYIIDNTNKSKISLITFNNHSKKIIPYTNDIHFIKQTISNLNTIPKSLSINKDININNIIKDNINKNTIIIVIGSNNYKDNLNNKNIFFINYSNKDNKTNKLIKTISKKEKKLKKHHIETYYVIALLILILLIIDFRDFRSKISWKTF